MLFTLLRFESDDPVGWETIDFTSIMGYGVWTNEFKSFLKLPILINTLRQAACKSLGGGQSAMMHFISMIDPEYH